MITSRSAHRRLLITLALVVILIAAAAPASAEVLEDSGVKNSYHTITDYDCQAPNPCYIKVYKIQNYQKIESVYVKVRLHDNAKPVLADKPYYESPVTLKIGSTVIGHGTAYYNAMFNSLGQVTGCQFWVDIDDIDIKSFSGTQSITLTPETGTLFNGVFIHFGTATQISDTHDIGFYMSASKYSGFLSGTHIVRSTYTWHNEISYDENNVYLTRKIDDNYYTSTITVTSDLGTVSDTSALDFQVPYLGECSWTVTSPHGKVFTGSVGADPDDPDDPGDHSRTGTVTMTDHNGTSISGFEVTAVNHYTGEEYTVSTDTDVAVISLPMDRTVEIRNPQTGVYEEAPVGYYRFYGQKPGYKMLNEEGIKVSVMPEKYDSYKLCDILVTSDTGPLTGKHQFQLRSWSDNSILQTGTISAKSATTGIWYNATVTNGIATLILPYDTSDALSEYAGHYYVYATSPGYEDIDYGVQISVYPRTVSEVKWIHLTPIGGVPTPDNVTLRIQAISETGQGVPNAEIFIAGVLGAGKDIWDTHIASSNGYLAVSVPGNSTYDIVVRGAGYYDSSRRIEVFTDDPSLIEFRLYLSGAPTIEPTTEPTGWVTGPPTTQPTSGIPDEDDGSDGFLMQAVRGIGNAFGVGFSTAKIIFGMLLALAIGFATAKQLRGGAAEFGLGLLGGTMLGILVGLIPVWTIVVLLLVVGLYIGNRYVGGGGNNG